MNKKFNQIFNKKGKIIIGAVHLPPLLGYPDFPGFDVAIENAIFDLVALEKGGVDAIIFENNYDIPHKTFVDAATISSMTFIGEKLKSATNLPMGISVLWNDYYTALSIAKILDLHFVRIPVFVDKIETACGVIEGNPSDVLEFRRSTGAKNIALFTDIHVKHAKLLSKKSLAESAKEAIDNYSDAVIITGKWTGDVPSTKEIESLREDIKDFPILIGSGIDKDNIKSTLKAADGAIVSTSLKEGRPTGEVNVKAYTQRIDLNSVKGLVQEKENI